MSTTKKSGRKSARSQSKYGKSSTKKTTTINALNEQFSTLKMKDNAEEDGRDLQYKSTLKSQMQTVNYEDDSYDRRAIDRSPLRMKSLMSDRGSQNKLQKSTMSPSRSMRQLNES